MKKESNSSDMASGAIPTRTGGVSTPARPEETFLDQEPAVTAHAHAMTDTEKLADLQARVRKGIEELDRGEGIELDTDAYLEELLRKHR